MLYINDIIKTAWKVTKYIVLPIIVLLGIGLTAAAGLLGAIILMYI